MSLPVAKNNAMPSINVPYIPKIFSKIIYEFGKMMIHDDRHDIGTFSSSLHPSSIHHCYIGGGMITASTVTSLLSDLHGMLDELEEDIDNDPSPVNPLLHALTRTARETIYETNQLVQQRMPKNKAYHFGFNMGGPRPGPVVVSEHINQVIKQDKRPIYMGKIQHKKPLPQPPKPKISQQNLLPDFLKNKGKTINT
jgi:hypothetical protein